MANLALLRYCMYHSSLPSIVVCCLNHLTTLLTVPAGRLVGTAKQARKQEELSKRARGVKMPSRPSIIHHPSSIRNHQHLFLEGYVNQFPHPDIIFNRTNKQESNTIQWETAAVQKKTRKNRLSPASIKPAVANTLTNPQNSGTIASNSLRIPNHPIYQENLVTVVSIPTNNRIHPIMPTIPTHMWTRSN